MKDNNTKYWSFALGGSIILLLNIIFIPVNAEKEPNDSLDQPQSIYEGEVTGNVSSTSNITDMDIFKLTSPPDCVIFLIFKKIDLKPGEITFNYYDSFQSHNSDYYDYDNDYSLSTPGETARDSFTNLDTEDSMFIKVVGNGQYSIKVHIVPLPEKDPPSQNPDDIEIDSDRVDGMVYSMEWEDFELEDKDAYYYVPSSSNIKITLQKTDSDDGIVKMHIGQSWYDLSSSEDYIEVSNEDSEKSIDVQMDYWSDTIYILISGKGNYSFTIEDGPDIALLSVLGGTVLMMFCMLFLTILPPIIIIVVVIIIITKHNKKKKEQQN